MSSKLKKVKSIRTDAKYLANVGKDVGEDLFLFLFLFPILSYETNQATEDMVD